MDMIINKPAHRFFATAKRVKSPVVSQSTKVFVNKDLVKDTVLYQGVFKAIEEVFLNTNTSDGDLKISGDWTTAYSRIRAKIINDTDCYKLCLNDVLQDEEGIEHVLKCNLDTTKRTKGVRQFIQGDVYQNTLHITDYYKLEERFRIANPSNDTYKALKLAIIIDVYLSHLDKII